MDINSIKNIKSFKSLAQEKLHPELYEYLVGGADDLRTFRRNIDAWSHYQIRPRRLVDVSKVDTSAELFGQKVKAPIVLAPIGILGMFHPEGASGSTKAAKNKGLAAITSTVTNQSYQTIVASSNYNPWFQLYPTTNISARNTLVKRAEENACKVLVWTIDVPVIGNRERHAKMLVDNVHGRSANMGNLHDLIGPDDSFHSPSMTWEFLDWLKQNTKMQIILKGIMTHEDARIAVDRGADGIIISNHGGRQLESDLSTIECLEEVINEVNGKIPVLIDGGIRRGTDIFKALALGATAVCIGRPYVYGLAVAGQKGVERILDILTEELERNMRLAGVTNISEFNTNFVRRSYDSKASKWNT